MKVKERIRNIKKAFHNKAIKYSVIVTSVVTPLAIACNAEETAASSGSSELQTAFTTGLTGVKSDFMGFIGSALPIALGIAGIGLAVTLGWKFFKKIGK